MCEITIKTPVIGIGPDPLSIKITGTVIDCAADIEGDQVIVEIACEPGNPFAEVSANVSGQEWDVIIPVPSTANCTCGSSVFITARCARDPNCSSPPEAEFEIRCPECPDVSFIELEPGEINCNADGTATLPVRALITNNTPEHFIAFLEGGTNPDGVFDPPNSINSIGVLSTNTEVLEVKFRYPTPSTPQPFVRFTKFNGDPTDCPNVPLPVGSLPKCPCPEVENIVVNVEDCTAFFKGEFSVPEGCTFTWDFGDNTADITTALPETSHTYTNAGVYAVAVTANCPGCIGISTVSVTIVDCIPPPVGACCFPDNTCEIISEEECRTKGGKYQGDGTNCDACNAPPPCGKPTEAFALLQAILLSGFIILNFLKFCMQVPIPTWLYALLAGLAFSATIAWGIYELLCLSGLIKPECCFNKCDRLYMSWIPLVTAGIVAFYVGGCCGNWWTALSIGLLASGLGLFAWWVAGCKPSKCEIRLAWLFVMVSAIGASFGIIEGLLELTSLLDSVKEALKLCLRPWIRISVLIFGAYLAWEVRKCITKPEAPPAGDADN